MKGYGYIKILKKRYLVNQDSYPGTTTIKTPYGPSKLIYMVDPFVIINNYIDPNFVSSRIIFESGAFNFMFAIMEKQIINHHREIGGNTNKTIVGLRTDPNGTKFLERIYENNG